MRGIRSLFTSFRYCSILPVMIAAISAASAAPHLQLVGGETIDWGKVGPSVLRQTIQLANTGTDTLRIKGVWPSCGCTSAPIDRSEIAPGDTGTINIAMDMSEYSGDQVKSVTIWTNDPKRGEINLILHALVIRELEFYPSSLPLLRDAMVGEPRSAVIDVKNNTAEPVVISPPTFVAKKNDMHTPDSLLVRFNMTSSYKLSPGETLRIVTVIFPTAPGTLYGDLLIKTSSPTLPLFRTSLYCSATDVAVITNDTATDEH